jgi:hypothetical protein
MLVYGLYLKATAIPFKDLVTVWAGHQDVFHSMVKEVVSHLAEHGLKMLLSAQIMRGFSTAVQDNTKSGDCCPEVIVKGLDLVRSGAWKRAAGKQYGITGLRQGIIGIPPGSPSFFIIQDNAVIGEILRSKGYGLTAHLQ